MTQGSGESRVNRRNFLKVTTGTASWAFVSGCLGNKESSTEKETQESTDKNTDQNSSNNFEPSIDYETGNTTELEGVPTVIQGQNFAVNTDIEGEEIEDKWAYINGSNNRISLEELNNLKFDESGEYVIGIVAEGPNDQSRNSELTIRVNEKIQPDVNVPSDVKLGEEFTVDASSSEGPIDKSYWIFGGENNNERIEGLKTDYKANELGALPVENVLQGRVQEKSTNKTVTVGLGNNTEFRLRHLDYLDPKNEYGRNEGVTIIDEERIRRLSEIGEIDLEQRERYFNFVNPISDFISYENIRGVSSSEESQKPTNFELKNLDDNVLANIDSELDKVRSEQSFNVYEGFTEFENPRTDKTTNQKYSIVVNPEDNMIQEIGGTLATDGDELDYGLDKAIDLVEGGFSMKYRAEDYIESNLFNSGNIIAERLNHTPRNTEIPWNGFAREFSTVESRWNVFYSAPLVLQADESLAEKYVGPFGPEKDKVNLNDLGDLTIDSADVNETYEHENYQNLDNPIW